MECYEKTQKSDSGCRPAPLLEVLVKELGCKRLAVVEAGEAENEDRCCLHAASCASLRTLSARRNWPGHVADGWGFVKAPVLAPKTVPWSSIRSPTCRFNLKLEFP